MARPWSIALMALAAMGWTSLAHPADCPASRTLNESVRRLEADKSLLQRHEWLLLEYLSSDKSEASRALFEKEVKQSAERTRAAIAINAEVMALPAAALTSPQEGTAECEVLTRAATLNEELVSTRTKEIDAYTREQFPFLGACHQIADALVRYAAMARDPQTSSEKIRGTRIALSFALGPAMYRSRVSPDDFDVLAAASLESPELPDAPRTAYLSLRCLKHYQGQTRGLKPLKEAVSALAACNTVQWIELGTCTSSAVLRAK